MGGNGCKKDKRNDIEKTKEIRNGKGGKEKN